MLHYKVFFHTEVWNKCTLHTNGIVIQQYCSTFAHSMHLQHAVVRKSQLQVYCTVSASFHTNVHTPKMCNIYSFFTPDGGCSPNLAWSRRASMGAVPAFAITLPVDGLLGGNTCGLRSMMRMQEFSHCCARVQSLLWRGMLLTSYAARPCCMHAHTLNATSFCSLIAVTMLRYLI